MTDALNFEADRQQRHLLEGGKVTYDNNLGIISISWNNIFVKSWDIKNVCRADICDIPRIYGNKKLDFIAGRVKFEAWTDHTLCTWHRLEFENYKHGDDAYYYYY